MTGPSPDIRHACSSTVGSLFLAQARQRGDALALVDGERRLGYAALAQRTVQLARALAARGIGRGDRIAILSENRAEYVEVQLAAAHLGAIAACQNHRMADAELQYCLRHVAPAAAFVSPRMSGRLAALGHGIAQVVSFDTPYEALIAQAPADAALPAVDPEDGLILLYTSGTTGQPKAAVISHRAEIARMAIFRIDYGLQAEDGFCAWPPMFHMGSTDSVLSTLMSGGTVICLDGPDPERIADTVAQYRIGHLPVINGMDQRVIDTMRTRGIRPRGIRLVGAMADLLAPRRVAEISTLFDAPFLNTFGATETGIAPLSGDSLPIGSAPERLSKRPNSLIEIRLVDSEDREVPTGQPGELTVRGPSLFSGYWNAPEANARDFRGGWFHMGDVFVRRDDGRYDFVDRAKYLIKSGGENIYPAEIERVLLLDPRIAEAAVVRRADAQWGEVPVAFVVRRDPGIDARDIEDLCRRHIAGYKRPKEIHFIGADELPRNSLNKVERHKLEARLREDAAAR